VAQYEQASPRCARARAAPPQSRAVTRSDAQGYKQTLQYYRRGWGDAPRWKAAGSNHSPSSFFFQAKRGLSVTCPRSVPPLPSVWSVLCCSSSRALCSGVCAASGAGRRQGANAAAERHKKRPPSAGRRALTAGVAGKAATTGTGRAAWGGAPFYP